MSLPGKPGTTAYHGLGNFFGHPQTYCCTLWNDPLPAGRLRCGYNAAAAASVAPCIGPPTYLVACFLQLPNPLPPCSGHAGPRAAAAAASADFPSRDGVMAFIRQQSPEGDRDLLPGLCLFVEKASTGGGWQFLGVIKLPSRLKHTYSCWKRAQCSISQGWVWRWPPALKNVGCPCSARTSAASALPTRPAISTPVGTPHPPTCV